MHAGDTRTDLIKESSTKGEKVFGVSSKYSTSAEGPIASDVVIAHIIGQVVCGFKVVDCICEWM